MIETVPLIQLKKKAEAKVIGNVTSYRSTSSLSTGKLALSPGLFIFLVSVLLLHAEIMIAQYTWTPPIPIDTLHPATLGGFMAVDDSGNIYVTWGDNRGYDSIIVARSTDHGKSWKSTSLDGSDIGAGPNDLVVDHNGFIWLLWISRYSEFSPAYLNLSKSIDRGQTFSLQFRSRSYSNGFFESKLAVDNENNVYMLWDDAIFKLTRFREGNILQRVDANIPADTVSIGLHAALAVSNNNAVHCEWEQVFYESATGYHWYILYARSVDSGATFGKSSRIDTADHVGDFYDHETPHMAVDRNDVIYSTYVRAVSSTSSVINFVKSTDGGISFSNPALISDSASDGDSEVSLDSSGGLNVIYSTNTGPWHRRSIDGGQTFSSPGYVGYLAFRDMQSSRDGRVFLSVLSGGYPYLTSTDVMLSVADDRRPPPNFQLFQNFPNPFNPTTTIQFELNEPSEIRLSIVDVAGKEVVTLLQGRMGPGRQYVHWDASDYSSGFYFLTLKSNRQFIQVRKMILIK